MWEFYSNSSIDYFIIKILSDLSLIKISYSIDFLINHRLTKN